VNKKPKKALMSILALTPQVLPFGYWGTAGGMALADKASHIADACMKGDRMRRFGMIQEASIHFKPDPRFPYAERQMGSSDSETSGSAEAANSEDCPDDNRKPSAIFQPVCLEHADLLQRVGRGHKLTEDMCAAIAKNPGSELRELMNRMANLAVTMKGATHLWHVLQYGYKDLLSIAREGDKGSNAGNMASMPCIHSPHSKKTNKRLKRFHEEA
jgi:hypothetical protein